MGMIVRAMFGEATDVCLPFPIDTDGEPVTSLATGDLTITEDDLTGHADLVDADDGDLDAFSLTDGVRFQLSAAECSPPTALNGRRAIFVSDQPAGTAYITDQHLLITTDSHLAAEPNDCVWAGPGAAAGQDVDTIVLGADVDGDQPSDKSITINVDDYFIVTSGDHAGARGYVKAFATNTITPRTNLALALNATDIIRVYRDLRAPANVLEVTDTAQTARNIGASVIAASVTGLDAAALQQIVDDLENGGRLDLLIDAIKAKTDTSAQTGEAAAAVGTLNDIAASDVVTALLAAVIEGSITFKQALAVGIALGGGKIVDNGDGTYSIYNVAGTVKRMTAATNRAGNPTFVFTDL